MRRHTYDASPPRASHRSRINRGSCFRTAQKDPSQGRGSPSWVALIAKPGTQCRRNHIQASVCYIRCEEYTLFLDPCSGTRSPSRMWCSKCGPPRTVWYVLSPSPDTPGAASGTFKLRARPWRGSQGVRCEESKTALLDLQS